MDLALLFGLREKNSKVTGKMANNMDMEKLCLFIYKVFPMESLKTVYGKTELIYNGIIDKYHVF